MTDFFSKYKNEISNVLVCGIAASIPLTIKIGNIFIITSTVWSIIFLLMNKRYLSLPPKYIRGILFFSLLYFCFILISTIYSYNYKTGLKLVDKSMFFVLMPLIIFVLVKTVQSKKVLISFVLSTFTASIFCIVTSAYESIIYQDLNKMFFYDFTKTLDQHPVYFSYYIVLSLLILYTKNIKFHKVLDFVIKLILILSLILSFSKISISLFFIFLIVNMIYKKDFFKVRSLSFFIGVAVTAVILLSQRFINDLEFDLNFKPSDRVENAFQFSKEDKEFISDLELRYVFGSIAIYHCHKDSNMTFGYGVGDAQDYLDYYYMKYNLAPFWYEGYNIHNQYLQLLFSGGFVLLSILLLYLYKLFKISFKEKNRLMILFLIFITCAFLFESVLQRVKGVIFFVFFCNLFIAEISLKYESRNHWL